MSKQRALRFAPSRRANTVMTCNHQEVRALLLQQWKELTAAEIEATGYSKEKLAQLIERHYGIHHRLGENYLSNLERTLPMTAPLGR